MLSIELLLSCLVAGVAVSAGYDPLEVPPGTQPAQVDLDVTDAARDRTIPVRVYLPPDRAGRCPVVLFSHGLGGSRKGCGYLGEHWSRRGYVAVFLQHLGSDESVWLELPPGRRPAAMQAAASLENFRSRVLDGDREARNPNHHRAILAVTTAFWDAFLRGEGDARAWLDGAGPGMVLEADDRWQRK